MRRPLKMRTCLLWALRCTAAAAVCSRVAVPGPASLNATVAAGTSASVPGPAKGRKRSYNAGLDCVVQLLEESKQAGKLRQAELKMPRQALHLQKQSVDLQREMNGIMAQYFGNTD